jgi:hypothetical protein
MKQGTKAIIIQLAPFLYYQAGLLPDPDSEAGCARRGLSPLTLRHDCSTSMQSNGSGWLAVCPAARLIPFAFSP